MPLVRFTAALTHHVDAPPQRTSGASVGEALAEVFAARPDLRGYVLDDQGAVRYHVVVFVDGIAIRDRRHLGDPVGPEAEIWVMQALSGG